MSHRLYLWDEADLDVVDAVVWYEGQRIGLGAELLLELDAVILWIAQTPLQFPEVREGVRRALLHRFPYSVHFKVSQEVIEVVGILHQYRNPTVWEQRLIK